MASLSIPAGMTEKEYFETIASEADFLKWYNEQDLPTYETPSVTADIKMRPMPAFERLKKKLGSIFQ